LAGLGYVSFLSTEEILLTGARSGLVRGKIKIGERNRRISTEFRTVRVAQSSGKRLGVEKTPERLKITSFPIVGGKIWVTPDEVERKEE